MNLLFLRRKRKPGPTRAWNPEAVEWHREAEALDTAVAQRERICRDLQRYLSADEARETAARLHDVAIDADGEIGRILQDPLVGKFYEYDGEFFTARSVRLCHTAFDGLHILKSLSKSTLETFFRGRDKQGAIRWMLEELGQHAWVARIRRMNWEEFGTLSLLPPEVLREITDLVREGRKEIWQGLSSEEVVFFQSFEAQMSAAGADGMFRAA